jgi:hypothetical protein
MHWISTIRLITFGKTSESHPLILQLHSFLNDLTTVFTTLFSVIVVALSADLIALTGPSNYLTFSPLSLATGLITLFTIIPMYSQPRGCVCPASLNGVHFFAYRFIVDLCRRGAFFSYTVVEISWLCMHSFSCIVLVTDCD